MNLIERRWIIVLIIQSILLILFILWKYKEIGSEDLSLKNINLPLLASFIGYSLGFSSLYFSVKNNHKKFFYLILFLLSIIGFTFGIMEFLLRVFDVFYNINVSIILKVLIGLGIFIVSAIYFTIGSKNSINFRIKQKISISSFEKKSLLSLTIQTFFLMLIFLWIYKISRKLFFKFCPFFLLLFSIAYFLVFFSLYLNITSGYRKKIYLILSIAMFLLFSFGFTLLLKN